MSKVSSFLIPFLLFTLSFPLLAESPDSAIEDIDDSPGVRGLEHPEWFSETFMDLREDLQDAKNEGKRGIIVYFGQTDCAYCEALLQVNFGKEKEIVQYTRQHFNVISIDIWGSKEVTDMDGTVMTESKFAEKHRAHFTPSLFFYLHDVDTPEKEVLRMNGFYPPYLFRGALEYVIDGYYKQENLKDYLARADPPAKFDLSDINEQDFFIKPPYVFDRRFFKSPQPLLVFFEQRSCHACDILHTDPINDPQVQQLLKKFEVVQLDSHSDTPTITPSGEKLTAKQWAEKLNIFYKPTLVFFDEAGQEIIRVDSVIRLYRLRGILDFIAQKGYLEAPTFQRWREDLQAQGI